MPALEDLRAARSRLVGIAVALGSIALITGLIFGLRQVMPVVATGVVYLLAVLLVSSTWGRGLGVFTAVGSALAWNFFHIPPTGRFTVADGENWLALAVFLVAALVTSALAHAARARGVEAERGAVRPRVWPSSRACCCARRAHRRHSARWRCA